MNRLQPEYDSYMIEEPSDDELEHSSSEDELDVLLHGTPEQKRKLIRECLTGESESSSDDEFEKEMEKELNCTMKSMEGSWNPAAQGASSGCSVTAAEQNKQSYYDDIYFDSDSEDESLNADLGDKQRRKQKRQVQTNDELLYDPKEDDRDQEWVDARRRGHESYKTQYRAMFVMNCSVNKEEVLRFPDPPPTKNRRRDRKKMKLPPTDQAPATQNKEEEMYHPVKCNECSHRSGRF